MTSVPTICGMSSALIHYFLLVFFGWTAVEAVWLYLYLVKILDIQSVASKFTLKAGIPTWGERSLLNSMDEDLFTYYVNFNFNSVVPLVVVIVCAGATSKYYVNPF